MHSQAANAGPTRAAGRAAGVQTQNKFRASTPPAPGCPVTKRASCEAYTAQAAIQGPAPQQLGTQVRLLGGRGAAFNMKSARKICVSAWAPGVFFPLQRAAPPAPLRSYPESCVCQQPCTQRLRAVSTQQMPRHAPYSAHRRRQVTERGAPFGSVKGTPPRRPARLAASPPQEEGASRSGLWLPVMIQKQKE